MFKLTEKNDCGNFRYVDFASARQQGFRNNVVDIKDVPALADKFGSHECYATFFLFSKDILDYMKNNLVNERHSVAGYNGMLHATYFPLDIDCKDLALARSSALDAIEALTEMGVDEFGIKVYFSGSKGFHIQADSRFFGVTPSERLNLYFSEMRKRIARLIEDNGLIDQQIKDAVRLWRLPNTINAKSNLYKVRLYESEYRHLGIKDIKELARKKRTLHDTDPTGLLPKHYIGLSDKANKFYLGSVAAVNRTLDRKNSYAQDGSTGFRHNGLCEAKKRILESHIEPGERNNCALILASYFRESGRNIENAKKLLSNWNIKNNIGLPDSEISTVVKSAYSKKEPYSFGCNSLVTYCPFENKTDCNFYRK